MSTSQSRPGSREGTMGEGPGGALWGTLSPGMYLTEAGMTGVVHICEVLPIGIHEAMVGAALTAGAAGT